MRGTRIRCAWPGADGLVFQFFPVVGKETSSTTGGVSPLPDPENPVKKLLCIALAAAAGGAHAQTPALRSYCHATPEERAVADATAFMIQKSQLIDNGNGTYRINTTPFTTVGSGPVCTSDPLYGAARAPSGRTAFVVGGDGFKAMVTAPHATTAGFNPNDFAVIFGLHDTLTGGICTPANFTAIPAANVYFPPTLSVIANTYSASAQPADYMLFQLDRNLPASVKPLALRRNGKPDVGDPLLIVSHYARFAAQIGTGATIEGITPAGLDIGTAPTALGSSGAAVYNLRKKLVETIVASPAPGLDYAQKPGETCYGGLPLAPELHFVNNGNLSELVATGTLPAADFTLTPTTTVVHRGPVGGTLTNRTTTFTVTPTPGTGSAASYRIATHGPANFDVRPSRGFTPTPGSPPQEFSVDITSAATACGVYNADVAIVKESSPDGTVVARIPHRLEIGVNDFDVSPRGEWSTSMLGPPFAQSRVLTISNPRTTPVTITVTRDQPWIKVNNTSSATLSLAAAGASGSSGNVTLTIDDSIGGGSGAVVTRTGSVRVQSTQPGCDLNGPTVVSVVATAGLATRSAITDTFLDGPAPGQTFGPPVEFNLDFSPPNPLVPSDYYVADADLELGFYSDNSFGFPIADTDTLIKVEVVAPDGTVAAVWDRNNAPGRAYFRTKTIDQSWGAVTLETLRLDDATTPSLGPNPLSTLNGEAGEGVWKVRIYSTTSGVVPMWAQLTLKRS
jgi:hypothetical protein